jgi:hypothetical protein
MFKSANKNDYDSIGLQSERTKNPNAGKRGIDHKTVQFDLNRDKC